ncbi:MAG: RNA pseudouridine synthase, partial [Planctomycetes bacterium]|nr:RNA pseudouridine synthase [Planctomycetota bacterium]
RKRVGDGESVPGPIHRLDAPASGLILVAFSAEAKAHFSELMREEKIKKSYLAVVFGHPPVKMQEGFEWQIWRYALENRSCGRDNPAGKKANRLPAQTSWIVQKAGKECSLLELKPRHGRIHQIRRHCVLAGFPIEGESRYCSKERASLLKYRLSFDRLALHASSLRFCDSAGKEWSFTSPEPPEFEKLLG